jgi:hypothetical protein
MSFLRKRFPTVDKAIDRFGYWWAVFGPGGILSVLGSWAANSIKPISDLGWGAVAFVGVGVACIIMLVSSFCLIAWRYFNPLGPVEGGKVKIENPNTGQFVDLVEHIDRLETESKKRQETSLNASLALQGMLGKLEDKIERLGNDLTQLRDKTESDMRSARDSSLIITRSLRARDAESMISKSDAIIMELAPSLIRADSERFDGPGSWSLNFNTWNDAVHQIDSVVCQWQQHFKPFLDLRTKDYESCHRNAPDNIMSNETATKYKTLCLVHSRYLSERSPIFTYFSTKAADIP